VDPAVFICDGFYVGGRSTVNWIPKILPTCDQNGKVEEEKHSQFGVGNKDKVGYEHVPIVCLHNVLQILPNVHHVEQRF